MNLRPYQQRALDALRDCLRCGKRRVLLVAPCGSGKTVLFAEILRSYLAKDSGRAIVVVHRRELVDQALEKLAHVGVEAGVVMASDARYHPDRAVQVCSIQTLARRKDRLPPAGLVIYDEAHHSPSASAREVLSLYPEAILLGFTATPWRSDKLGLADLFPDHVVAATPAELTALGALVPYDAYAYDCPDLHEVSTVAGEYNQRELGLACNTSVLVGDCVEEYQRHAAGRRAIVFPVNVEHSKALVAEFAQRGFVARHLDWATPARQRASILEAFREGALQVLSSVGVLTEGFDAPDAEVCILQRPTKSLGLLLQMVGRVLRPAPGKSRALIHDHGGNLFRHGFPDDPRDYSPAATPQRTLDLLCCTDCGYLVSSWPPDGLCPHCHSVQHLPAEQREQVERRRGKEIVSGARLGRDEIQEMRDRFAGLGRELTPAQAARVLAATREQKAAEYLRLRGVAARKGFRPGFVAHQYRAAFGVWPRFAPGELNGVAPAETPFLPLPPRKETHDPPLPGTTTEAT